MTAKYYIELLTKLKQQLACKHGGRLSKGILFLQYNSAPHKAAITHKRKLSYFRFEVLKHPELAPLDRYLFPDRKGRKFSSVEETILAEDGWFAAQPKEFFLDG
jgi:hypothetical protein